MSFYNSFKHIFSIYFEFKIFGSVKLLAIFSCVMLLCICKAVPLNLSEELNVHSNLTKITGNVSNNHSKLPTNLLKKLTYDIIKPPDHLEGVKMERDGHLNKEFRKEVLLGDSKDAKKDEPSRLLIENFSKADKNKDNFLTQEELENWIAEKVKEHFYKAVRENFLIFSSLDKNHNGRVSWDEYHINFMLEQGFNETYAKKHAENHRSLKRKVKEKILLDKAAWSEAANSDPDALNIDEFLTFRHPEHSHVSLLNMVNDIIDGLDMDGDEVLTEEEFSEMPDSDETPKSNTAKKMERIREFREAIDFNKDGKVNRQELLMYNDPENPIHSKNEARKLISIADANKDGKLSLREMLAKQDLFLGSKMVDSARSFHDEF